MYVFIIILSFVSEIPILKINSKGLKYPLERKWNSKVETIQTLNCNAFDLIEIYLSQSTFDLSAHRI